jgi:glycosyltransferase involved in cell wall biosynthesis
MKKAIWLTWEVQRRNLGISSGLGIRQYTIDSGRPRLLRYLESIAKTIAILQHEKPEVVFAQNPSTVLALLLLLIKPFCLKKVVLDAHNTGIFLLEQRYTLLNRISEFIQKKADLTLVTNEGMQREIERNGGRARVIFDRIPIAGESRRPALREGWSLVFVCSFAKDEPYQSVFDCARRLPPGITIYVTGNHRGKVDAGAVPDNVVLTGFLTEVDYWGLLGACDIIMDLTTLSDCLVCGAYEGIAVGKPLILSANAATRKLFCKGCVYVEADAESIRNGILKSMADYAENVKGIRELRHILESRWHPDIEALRQETLGGR